MIADLIAYGDHVGLAWRSSAAVPATCGLAIDVPEIMSAPGPGMSVPAMICWRCAGVIEVLV